MHDANPPAAAPPSLSERDLLARLSGAAGWPDRVRLLPNSLLWRTFLLLALLVIVTTTIWYFIFRAYESEPRARALSQNLITIVNLTRVALITAQPDKRLELLEDLSDREGIQVYPADPGDHVTLLGDDRPTLQRAAEYARAQLGPDTRVAVEREGLPGIWVSFDIDDDEYWVRIPRERMERRIALQWTLWGIFASALALVAAYFIVSRIAWPLRALSRAAAALGKGQWPRAVRETGPTEIRSLTRSFNQMMADLARLDQDRGLILAGISHDLRTPLARMRLGIEMSGADESLRSGMHADIEEMDAVIGQFLDFARMDGGEATQPLALSGLAAEVVEHHRKLGHPVTAELADTPEMPLKPHGLRRAVGNLVDNALKYSGGAVLVTTSTEGRAAVLEVSDRGPGIPPAQADRMKLPFTRLEEARTGASGSGLGLAIVDRVVRAHNGRFELLPNPGGGLLARITLTGK
jgi:two-component system osmolarity sensor histidine kinase EnvZ